MRSASRAVVVPSSLVRVLVLGPILVSIGGAFDESWRPDVRAAIEAGW